MHSSHCFSSSVPSKYNITIACISYISLLFICIKLTTKTESTNILNIFQKLTDFKSIICFGLIYVYMLVSDMVYWVLQGAVRPRYSPASWGDGNWTAERYGCWGVSLELKVRIHYRCSIIYNKNVPSREFLGWQLHFLLLIHLLLGGK